MKHRSISSTEVTLRLPSAAVTELKGQVSDRDTERDALGNTKAERILARGAIRVMAGELTEGDQFTIEPNGEIKT